MFSAIHKTLKSKPSRQELQSNFFAGLTVGVIALPLSMGLAIACGTTPEHGLYTAIIAGIVIALSGGSKVNISGPTAAFVVIILPIVQEFGLGGLMFSGFIAGVMQVIMGSIRLGGLIQIVPYPVTIGFTAGIGTVIATLQIRDFLGLDIAALDGNYVENVAVIVRGLPSLSWEEASIGALTFVVLVFWNKLNTRVPSHIIAIVTGTAAAWLASRALDHFDVATIGSRFQYQVNGVAHHGIPPHLPSFSWPWEVPGKDGQPIGFSFVYIRKLIGPAFAIAVLGALESLLCAVVADGMSGKKHNPNDELIGQGIGNMICPLFGGLPATAAIARTAVNIRSGGSLPLASIIHSVFILVSILSLAPLLSYIPMASIAALLLMVAWNMSEARHVVRIVKVAPGRDIFTLLACFSLTVLFDMEIAVTVGIGLAAVLFIRRSVELTGVELIEHKMHEHPRASDLPSSLLIYDIDGAMFFGSAQKALNALTTVRGGIKVVILDMSDVTMLDMTAMVAMESIADNFKHHHIKLIINNLDSNLICKLRKVNVEEEERILEYSRSMDDAITRALD